MLVNEVTKKVTHAGSLSVWVLFTWVLCRTWKNQDRLAKIRMPSHRPWQWRALAIMGCHRTGSPGHKSSLYMFQQLRISKKATLTAFKMKVNTEWQSWVNSVWHWLMTSQYKARHGRTTGACETRVWVVFINRPDSGAMARQPGGLGDIFRAHRGEACSHHCVWQWFALFLNGPFHEVMPNRDHSTLLIQLLEVCDYSVQMPLY